MVTEGIGNDKVCPGTVAYQCGVCGHTIADDVYDVNRHAIVPAVGVCISCYDHTCGELQDSNLLNSERGVAPFIVEESCRPLMCSLCADGGELLCCGDGSTCHHNFCTECVSSVMGEGYLKVCTELLMIFRSSAVFLYVVYVCATIDCSIMKHRSCSIVTLTLYTYYPSIILIKTILYLPNTLEGDVE